MLGVSSPATTTIITNGLAIRPATDRMLSAWKFHLYVETDIIPKMPERTGGGPYPGDAWNKVGDIQNFYQPTNGKVKLNTPTSESGMPFLVPLDDEGNYFGQSTNIVLKARIAGKEIEKTYVVNERWAPMAVTISKLTNVTYDRMYAIVEKLTKIVHKAKIVIENFRKV